MFLTVIKRHCDIGKIFSVLVNFRTINRWSRQLEATEMLFLEKSITHAQNGWKWSNSQRGIKNNKMKTGLNHNDKTVKIPKTCH